MSNSTSQEAARKIARNILLHAKEYENETSRRRKKSPQQQHKMVNLQSDSEEEEEEFEINENKYEIDDFNDGCEYDSDDPRSFGGRYFWDLEQKVSIAKRISDYLRLCLFHILRGIGFMLLVLQHFFGLNHSRFQWALDLVEQEQVKREQEAISRRSHREN